MDVLVASLVILAPATVVDTVDGADNTQVGCMDVFVGLVSEWRVGLLGSWKLFSSCCLYLLFLLRSVCSRGRGWGERRSDDSVCLELSLFACLSVVVSLLSPGCKPCTRVYLLIWFESSIYVTASPAVVLLHIPIIFSLTFLLLLFCYVAPVRISYAPTLTY